MRQKLSWPIFLLQRVNYIIKSVDSRDQKTNKQNLVYKKYRSKLICYECSVRWNETEIGRGGGATETEPSLSLSLSLITFTFVFASRIDFFFDFESTTCRDTWFTMKEWKNYRRRRRRTRRIRGRQENFTCLM